MHSGSGTTVAAEARFERFIESLSTRLFLLAALLLSAGAALALPPDLTPLGNQTVREGATVDIALNASDPDGGNVTFSATGLPGFCSITDATGPDGNMNCAPGAGTDGNYNITVIATDDNVPAEQSSDNFVLTVNQNSAPSISNIGNQSVREGEPLVIDFTASDPESDGLIYTATGLPAFCNINDNTGPTGQITCNPGAGTAGSYGVTVIVTDGGPLPETDSDGFTLSVTANSPPNLSDIPNQSVAEGGSLDIGLSASDPDSDNVTFTASGLPGFCSITDNLGPNGNINCSPLSGDSGSYNVTVTATDDGPIAASSVDSFTLNVSANNPPNLTNITDQSVAEGGTLNIGLSATDPDGHSVTFGATGLPTFCSITDSTGPTGNISCSPTGGDGGTYNITVTATDDGPIPASSSDSFTLSVSANNPPNLSNIANQSMAEGETLDITLSATDPDGDSVTFTASGLPGFCSITDNTGPDGQISCTATAGDGGSYNITVTASDDGVIPANASDSFTLSVSANQPPDLTPIPDQSVVEGDTLNITLSATDPDGDNVTFTTSGLPGFCTLTDNTGPTGAIDCSPQVGDDGSYPVTVTATDDGLIPASSSDPFTLSVGANQPPAASNVAITGDPSVGSTLQGNYTYSDPEGDVEGASTFRWLRDGTAIPGATAQSYTVVSADIETDLVFEVTPVAQTGATPGTPARSSPVTISNSAPSITGQLPLETPEETAITLQLTDFTVSDADSTFPDDFTLSVGNGANYSRTGNTITPNLDFNGDLSVPVTVNDGFTDSAVFNATVTVTAVNDRPIITGQDPLSTPEDTSLTIVLTDLSVADPDNSFPAEFTLTLGDGANYTRGGPNGNTITPDENFNGNLSVPATVTDENGTGLTSAVFNLTITVDAENDTPVNEPEIADQNAVEDSPFTLDVSGNFSDADGDALTYSVAFEPALPSGNITIDSATGVLSGTPTEADATVADPVYTVTVRAEDPSGAFTEDEFILTISALGRANIALGIAVTPDTGQPGDQLQWTFAVTNPVGPAAGENVEINGSFVGTGLTVTPQAGTNCTITSGMSQSDFLCPVGAVPVGGSTSIVLTVATSQPTEVLAVATAAGAQRVPIDPNLEDNTAVEAAGVAERFSIGPAQAVGGTTILSITAGDVNGDGANDLVVGTVAGQPLQIFAADAPRASCDCQRDFVASPITIPANAAARGVALGDVDNDGVLDLVVANGGGQADNVYLNDGAGNFTLSDALEPSNANAVALGDFDNDGNLDIAIAASSPNLVYFGNGNGTFQAPLSLGDPDNQTFGVAVGRLDGNNRDDIVFANVGAASTVYTKNAGAGFTLSDELTIGDAVDVEAVDLNGDNLSDLVFARVSSGAGDIPSNPVLINQGSGNFGAPRDLLGISPTADVAVGDVNEDGLPDLVFINASGVHQVWNNSGNGFTLHPEQIIELGARAAVVGDLGDADTNDAGGHDLATGGSTLAGSGVYLNDSQGNLGRGDAVPPEITLLGEASVEVPAGSGYNDAGATATDNIDGDITPVATSTVNTAVVGTYSVTYNATDFAGNEATPVTRTVRVTPSAGGGGGGGGALGAWAVMLLAGFALAFWLYSERQPARRSVRIRRHRGE